MFTTNRYNLSAEEVLQIKESTIGVSCNGACKNGVLYNNGMFTDCSCIKEFKTVVGLISSGIPKKYWDFNYRNLLKKFIEHNEEALLIFKSYIGKLPEMLTSGYGLYITGMHGLAKTALGAYILKEALKQDQLCYFVRMSNLTKMCMEQFRDPEQKRRLQWIKSEVRLLLIDEIEKDYHLEDPSTFAGTHVNEFFDEVYGENKSLIVTSNVPKTDLGKVHSKNVIDRLEELVDVVLVGESYRSSGAIRDKILGVPEKKKQ